MKPESVRRLKVMTLVGTRPEVIKLSRIIAELDRLTTHTLVHSGQNFDPGLAENIFNDLDMRMPDHWLAAAGSSPAQTIAQTLERFDGVLATVQPDAVMIYGDTDTGLAAIAAKRRRIPIFHLEAGNRCFDQTVPEETNRRLIDHLSDINLTLSEHARRYLLAESFPADRVIKIGSPMAEVLHHHREKIDRSSILSDLQLEPKKYFLASMHRAENVDNEEDLASILCALAGLSAQYGFPVVISTHPRTKRHLGARENSLQGLRFLPPFKFTDYVKLQQNAACVLSDSGSLTEEASILDLPAVALRRQHERPEGMDEATVIMAGITSERILQAVEMALFHETTGERSARLVPDYAPLDVSRKVVRIILGYVDYVKRYVWHENGRA